MTDKQKILEVLLALNQIKLTYSGCPCKVPGEDGTKNHNESSYQLIENPSDNYGSGSHYFVPCKNHLSCYDEKGSDFIWWN